MSFQTGRPRTRDTSQVVFVAPDFPYYGADQGTNVYNAGYCLLKKGRCAEKHHDKILYADVLHHQQKPAQSRAGQLNFPILGALAKTLGITLNQVKAVPDEHTGTRCTWLIPGPTGELQHCGRHIVGDQSNLVGHYQKHMSAGVDAIPCPQPRCDRVYKGEDAFDRFKTHYDGHRDHAKGGGKQVKPWPTTPPKPSIVEFLNGKWYQLLDKPATDPEAMHFFLLNRAQYTPQTRDQLKSLGCFKGAEILLDMYNAGEFVRIPALEKKGDGAAKQSKTRPQPSTSKQTPPSDDDDDDGDDDNNNNKNNNDFNDLDDFIVDDDFVEYDDDDNDNGDFLVDDDFVVYNEDDEDEEEKEARGGGIARKRRAVSSSVESDEEESPVPQVRAFKRRRIAPISSSPSPVPSSPARRSASPSPLPSSPFDHESSEPPLDIEQSRAGNPRKPSLAAQYLAEAKRLRASIEAIGEKVRAAEQRPGDHDGR
ncbi:hypothetical protein JCM3766R1_003874 [Sporobolomyces carnicolor]